MNESFQWEFNGIPFGLSIVCIGVCKLHVGLPWKFVVLIIFWCDLSSLWRLIFWRVMSIRGSTSAGVVDSGWVKWTCFTYYESTFGVRLLGCCVCLPHCMLYVRVHFCDTFGGEGYLVSLSLLDYLASVPVISAQIGLEQHTSWFISFWPAWQYECCIYGIWSLGFHMCIKHLVALKSALGIVLYQVVGYWPHWSHPANIVTLCGDLHRTHPWLWLCGTANTFCNKTLRSFSQYSTQNRTKSTQTHQN